MSKRISNLSTIEWYFTRKTANLKHSRGKYNPGMQWKLTSTEVLDLWHQQEGRCAVTNLFMNHHADLNDLKNASIDRLDNNKGYSVKNIRLVCSAVNKMRGSLTESEFHWWVKQISIGELL
jgi:hypothetical protein|tara:strand:- start:544 stop:906 length:363 start_codon:yes stop_codon:yes gene_type:complete